MLFELAWLDFDSLENRIINARHTVRREIRAETEAEAKAAADRLWSEAQANSHKGWDWFDYPREPRLVQLVDWSPES